RRARRPDPRGEWIAGVERHVHDAAALHPILRPPRPLREHVPGLVAVVPRIGIDETPHRAVLARHFRLDAPPRPAVAGDDDRPLHGHAHALQALVVRGNPVVDVHEWPRDVAVRRVGVVGGELLLLLGRRGVTRYGALDEAGHEL